MAKRPAARRGEAAAEPSDQRTPTQLRNARKREKLKGERHEKKRHYDPSQLHIAAPLRAPVVCQAKQFFHGLAGGPGRFALHLGAVEGWRTEAKLAVRAGPAGPRIGLFAPGTHEVCHGAAGSSAHHAAINKAVSIVETACRAAGARGYDEQSGSGDLRYLNMSVQRSTGKVQLTLVWHAASEEEAGEPLRRLLERLRRSSCWHSVWANFHPAGRHVSRIVNYDPGSWRRLAGRRRPLGERLASLKLPYRAPLLRFPPHVFRQANLCGFEAIVAALRGFVPSGSRVVELYGGVGTIGLHVVDLAAALECSDENPHNGVCFRRAARGLPRELRPRVSYTTGAAATRVDSFRGADVLIVDPPRKGLDDEVVQALSGHARDAPGPWRVLYVSCGFPALRRDVERLAESGWAVSHAEGHVLFPGADHVETFCVLDHARRRRGRAPADCGDRG